MHIGGKGFAPDWLASKLYEHILDSNCQKDNAKEYAVVEESSEYIEFFVSKLSRVDLIEDLHHNEGLEQKCEVLGLQSGLIETIIKSCIASFCIELF
jgi:hypothetical protein